MDKKQIYLNDSLANILYPALFKPMYMSLVFQTNISWKSIQTNETSYSNGTYSKVSVSVETVWYVIKQWSIVQKMYSDVSAYP